MLLGGLKVVSHESARSFRVAVEDSLGDSLVTVTDQASLLERDP
jgi:hypothetical protein